jgi:excisionase family DNA binding protein
MSDSFLTASEVAELLRLNVETVYALAQKGELPGAKIGGQWRFLASDVARLFRTRVSQYHREGRTDTDVSLKKLLTVSDKIVITPIDE